MNAEPEDNLFGGTRQFPLHKHTQLSLIMQTVSGRTHPDDGTNCSQTTQLSCFLLHHQQWHHLTNRNSIKSHKTNHDNKSRQKQAAMATKAGTIVQGAHPMELLVLLDRLLL